MTEEREAAAVLAPLDDEQRAVALAVRGPVCVLAGAGTGKTRAVAHRIAYAAATGVADPARVLALTFTTRAAAELRGRLGQLAAVVPDAGLRHVQVRTFHAAALRQLTHFWPRTVGGPAPAVLDSKVAVLGEAARRAGTPAGLPELRDAAAEVEWAKVSGVTPDAYSAACGPAGRVPPLGPEATARLYAGYVQLCRERHVVDFESVLELTAAILAEHPEAAASVRQRYGYFTVDEYQDVNPLQKLLLDQWAGGRDDICVVGDPRQTIYSFAGATSAYLTGFAAEHPAAIVVRLVRSYRSTPQVVALANQLSAGDTARSGPQLTGHRAAGPAPELAEYPDEPQEAATVAAQAAALIKAGTVAGQIAVLVRVNAQTQGFEQALAEAGVSFRLRGAARFFDRPEVRQAVALLRSAVRTSAGEEPVAAVRGVLSGLGLTPAAPLGRGVARDRWESLGTLARLSDDFLAEHPGAGLAGLAAELDLRAQAGHEPAAGGVTLASLHAAKGLEWDAVFLPGLVEGNVPIVYAQSPVAVAEERRLLYVGVTRARERLFLSYAVARAPGGRAVRKPSRFLAGLRLPGDGAAWAKAGVPAQARSARGRGGAGRW